MTTPSITTTQPQWVSGRLAVHYGQPNKGANQYPPPAPPVSADGSPAAAESLASAIAAALVQLGLTTKANGAGADTAATASSASFESPVQQRATPQIQQYKNIASTLSGLAQALRASSGNSPATANGASNLTAVFQSLWTSLGASPNMAADASSDTMPSLQSFLEMLARNVSESGVTGLRGVFVDTVA